MVFRSSRNFSIWYWRLHLLCIPSSCKARSGNRTLANTHTHTHTELLANSLVVAITRKHFPRLQAGGDRRKMCRICLSCVYSTNLESNFLDQYKFSLQLSLSLSYETRATSSSRDTKTVLLEIILFTVLSVNFACCAKSIYFIGLFLVDTVTAKHIFQISFSSHAQVNLLHPFGIEALSAMAFIVNKRCAHPKRITPEASKIIYLHLRVFFPPLCAIFFD